MKMSRIASFYRSNEISAAVEADVSESLHDKGFALHTRGKSDHVHVLFRVAEDLRAVVNSSAGGGDAAVHTTLRDGLASHAAWGVEVGWVQSGVLVRHPGHLALASVHVGRGNID